ncbi:MAG TPA: hypothetical protein VNJ01_02165 [Bacteriovoracaceae bacterium]|nr:hypothetical protein [Bacteriovoracaceae bacterium]
MDVRYLVLTLFLLASCLPDTQLSRGDVTNSLTTGGSNGAPAPVPESETAWNFLNTVSRSISINVSNLNNAYLVGTAIEDYLGTQASGGTALTNFTNVNYCLVSSYTVGGFPKELRSRIIPISYYDFKTKRTVRTLRVDFNDVTNSTLSCGGSLRVQDNDGNYISEAAAPAPTLYDPNGICTNCTAIQSATKVRLFKKAGLLHEVPLNFIDLGSLSLQVDPNYNPSGEAGTCSPSLCVSRGFDCCLDNQCVKNATERPSARTQYATLLEVAREEIRENLQAYLNYPQLYYICGSSVPSTTGGTSGGGTTGEAEVAFTLLKKDLSCIEHLKSQSTVTPFHSELLIRTTPYTETLECLTGPEDVGAEMYFHKVIKRLYTTCGCAQTNLEDMISSCPAYEYTVTQRDSLNAPLRIECLTPSSDTGPVPLQQSVPVNSRTAPHRFFDDINGTERNITGSEKTYQSAGVTREYVQEGEKFEYQDEGKVLPVQAPFSMNAILGQMSVSLAETLPAKTVKVELDQVYILSTTSGYYTPCPTCDGDSWLEAFSAFPSTPNGVGLRAVGHTTERDVFSTNTTRGNYEDTIFGRACWIPPTMIPFSHLEKTSAADQRQGRLETQAALFVNGYQRDWYGFNRGALIGSFDGVTWFAVGKGRIVRATSKKLFLAINAPFADLASPTLHVVNVQAYDGITQAAQLDYDPEFGQVQDPQHNEAASCQAHHLCTTDTDCVTRLGWEYACADVKDLKSNLPRFDGNAVEKNSTQTLAPEKEAVGLDQILQQKRYPSASTKRCVYRGAGSLCLVNSGSLADLNKRKLLTCAPNFYCANTSSPNFNSQVARYGASLEDVPVPRNHFFGKDANVLGRPQHYSSGTATLSFGVRNALKENLLKVDALAASNTGLCLPGKSLPTATANANPFTQQTQPDAARRSDYISQVGSCNSTLFTTNRHASCPVIVPTTASANAGDFEMFTSATLATDYTLKASSQNSCGLETLHTNASLTSSADTLSTLSPFKFIEAKPLNSQIILDPTLVRDACFRRAGAVCHTDLECTPNKFHASQVDSFSLSYFGNSAERSYYSESLVCGQTDPKPSSFDTEAFKNFDMSKNRCCREVGSDLTTFTSDIPTTAAAVAYEVSSAGLKMSIAPGVRPNDPKRYSRLATVENIASANRPILSAYQSRDSSDQLLNSSEGVNVNTPNQWKTLNEANSETCCGGGWIRKFSDGSTDWTRRDRLSLEVANFSCINSRTPLITDPGSLGVEYNNNANDVINLVNEDYGDYCKDSTSTLGSCAQFTIPYIKADTEPVTDTSTPYATVKVNTINPIYNSSPTKDYFFTPRSADSDPAVFIDFASTSPTARKNITIRIPSYISRNAFDNNAALSIGMIISGETAVTPCGPVAGVATAVDEPTDDGGGQCDGACCYSYTGGSARVLKVVAKSVPAFTGKRVGVTFTVPTAGSSLGIVRKNPKSAYYYLKRLGRLELTGIPQMSYQALYCNDNSDRVLPGIFRSDIDTKAKFSVSSYSYQDAGGKRFTSGLGLQVEPVFSKNEYKCCTPLGKTVKDTSKCCSGFGTAQGTAGTTFTCALPPGTDLMVYFNGFVSNEGRGNDQPGGGLQDTHFEAQTGELILDSSVNLKISELGVAYCSSGKVRQGGAFGSFEPEPQGPGTDLSGRIHNIVDSSNDNGESSNAGTTINTGYTAFVEGFRWNHHYYCDD